MEIEYDLAYSNSSEEIQMTSLNKGNRSFMEMEYYF